MKRILFAVAVSLAAASRSWALPDASQNPDKVPSLGFQYLQSVGTETPPSTTSLSIGEQIQHDQRDFIADYRFPVTNFLTLNATGGITRNSWNLSPTQTFNLHETKVGAGFRIYFQK